MPTFKFDDRDIPFQPGETVIRAAQRSGVDVPHYCWHPGLSVAANCRMCLVELMPPPGRAALMLDVLAWDAEKQTYENQGEIIDLDGKAKLCSWDQSTSTCG